LYEVTYGGKWPAERVEKTGERIFNLQRVFNVMAGFSKAQDKLPQRFHKEILKHGPPKDISYQKKVSPKPWKNTTLFGGGMLKDVRQWVS